MPQVVVAALVLLSAGAACAWWLRHVPRPEWREVGIVGLVLVGASLATLSAVTGWPV